MKRVVFAVLFLFLFGWVSEAQAGDAATIVFREGYFVYTNYGFKAISEAFKGASPKSSSNRIVELNVEGGTFLLDLSEVVIVCRDRCPGLTVVDPRRAEKDKD